MGLGACCYRNTVGCFGFQTEIECTQQGGIYMGDGVACEDIDCDLDAIWSCCDGNQNPPVCIQGLTESECLSVDGRFPRAPAGCPPFLDCTPGLTGACCDPEDGSCFQSRADDCLAAGRCPQGPGTVCQIVPGDGGINCDLAFMSCCFTDGTCGGDFITRQDCINGFQGTPKCPVGCPEEGLHAVDCTQEVFGACCFSDGTCTQTAGEQACAGQLGVYQGDGTDCTTPGVNCGDFGENRECRPALPPVHDPDDVHHTANLCALALFGYQRRPDNDDEGNTMYGKYRLVTLHETRSTQVVFGDDQCRHHAGMLGMLPDGRVALALCSRHDNRSALHFGGFAQQPHDVTDPNGILEKGQWAGIAASANPRTGEVYVGSHAEYVGIVL